MTAGPGSTPSPEPIDAADAHDILFSSPEDTADALGEAAAPGEAGAADPTAPPSSISGEGISVGSTERFPNMVHRTVGAPMVDPSLRVERERGQRPAITPSKLVRPAHLAPGARKPRLDTVQVDYVPASAAPAVPARAQTPWGALGVSGPVFAFAVMLVVVMFLAIAAVVALARM